MAHWWAFHYCSPGWACASLRSEPLIDGLGVRELQHYQHSFSAFSGLSFKQFPCVPQWPFVIVAGSHHPEKLNHTGEALTGICLYRKDVLWETIVTMATIFRRD